MHQHVISHLVTVGVCCLPQAAAAGDRSECRGAESGVHADRHREQQVRVPRTAAAAPPALRHSHVPVRYVLSTWCNNYTVMLMFLHHPQ